MTHNASTRRIRRAPNLQGNVEIGLSVRNRGRTEQLASAGAVEQDWEIEGVTKNVRFLSPFSDTNIHLDVRHIKTSTPEVIVIDTEAIRIACHGKDSLYTEPQRLTRFPHLCEALKLAINYTLFRNGRGNIKDAVSLTLRNSERIFCWMMRNGIYRLADLGIEDLKELTYEIACKGWSESLEQNKRLETLLVFARKDPFIAKRIAGKSMADRFCISTVSLENEIGAPVNDSDIPTKFRKEVALLVGDKRRIASEPKPWKFGNGAHVAGTMRTLNVLSVTPVDSIQFFPYPNIEKSTRELEKIYKAYVDSKKKSATRRLAMAPPQAATTEESTTNSKPTPNLTTKETVALFSQAMAWTYDYAPAILEVLTFARAIFSQLEKPDDTEERAAKNAIIDYWETVCSTSPIPYKSISCLNRGNHSLMAHVYTLMYAQYITFGMNSARRSGEITGDSLPYGIYYGGLVRTYEDLPAWDIEFYIEKSLQDYAVFPANALMVDSTGVLERLFDLMRPLAQTSRQPKKDINSARAMKLFSVRAMTWAGLHKKVAMGFNPPSHMSSFFILADVNKKKFSGVQPPFRRMFATLFMRRYDLPEYPALRTYLVHFDSSSTHGYFSDRGKERPKGESIRELRSIGSAQSEPLIIEMREAGIEYMADQLVKLINGVSVGGLFPLLVLKLAKRLSNDVDFRKLSAERKAMMLAQRMANRGYGMSAMPHGVCTADNPRHTTSSAKCFNDGALHREDASPKRCSGCIHSMTNASYIENMQQLLAESEKGSANQSLPQSIREAHERRVSSLRRVIEMEISMGERNAKGFIRIFEAWETTVGDKLNATT